MKKPTPKKFAARMKKGIVGSDFDTLVGKPTILLDLYQDTYDAIIAALEGGEEN